MGRFMSARIVRMRNPDGDYTRRLETGVKSVKVEYVFNRKIVIYEISAIAFEWGRAVVSPGRPPRGMNADGNPSLMAA